ncbi:MAG: serine/threonine-protein kinase [Pirellulaceae bacterium]
MKQNAAKQCPTCARPMLADGSCGYCLLQLGKSDRQSHEPVADAELPTPEQLGRSFPQLEITRLVGRGGMGAIYHARQRALDRDVALKIIARNVAHDPTFQERFTREAKTLARLSHPNIVTVYDFGTTDDGLVYLLMEYVDGVNLREAMDAGSIRANEAIQVIGDMCAALQFAHDRGVVHRDIKPENVLLNEDGIVKVADFGLAKLVHDSPADLTLTNTRQVMGTLRYMAPEQFESPASVDHRADVYSLGVVFYELLTGQVPVGRFEVPSHINHSISPGLDEIVMRTLHREPPKRFQHVSEIAGELSHLQNAPAEIPHPRAEEPSVLSVSFSAEVLGSLALAVGNIHLEADTLEVSYRTRDNIFHIVKSATKSVRIPLAELVRLEWAPGLFASKIVIVPKSAAHADQLPNSDYGKSVLRIPSADSQTAASLVVAAQQREPALRNNNSNSAVAQRVAIGVASKENWKRVALGVMFLVCAALNIVGMILLLVSLADERDSEMVLAIILVPILSAGTFVTQIVGGIFCFSPYTRRMPLAAATISMLPLAPSWPLGFCVGAWAWWILRKHEDQSSHQRRMPILGNLFASSAGSRVHTTLMYIRESRWSKFIAAANLAALCALGLLFMGYRAGYYPTAIHYRVVDELPWNDEVDRIQTRLKSIGGATVFSDVSGYAGDKRLSVHCMKWAEPDVKRALAVSGTVQWAWIIEFDPEEEPGKPRVRVGGEISSSLLDDWAILAASPTAFHAGELTSIAGEKEQLRIAWTPACREAIEKAQPPAAVGLALIVEDLVEGFAAPTAVTARGVTFTMSANSNFEPAAIEAALRGPALTSPLELLE